MKTRVCLLVGLIGLGITCLGQGRFIFSNGTAPTRLYSIDGPLAGPGIWAQMLAGLTPDDMFAVGTSVEHHSNGIAFGHSVVVPGIVEGTYGYVQMVAWDGTLWGTELENVPLDQLGRTDAFGLTFSCCLLPDPTPIFTQPAIVPIPEPQVWAILLFGVVPWLVLKRRLLPNQS